MGHIVDPVIAWPLVCLECQNYARKPFRRSSNRDHLISDWADREVYWLALVYYFNSENDFSTPALLRHAIAKVRCDFDPVNADLSLLGHRVYHEALCIRIELDKARERLLGEIFIILLHEDGVCDPVCTGLLAQLVKEGELRRADGYRLVFDHAELEVVR